jgi:transposase
MLDVCEHSSMSLAPSTEPDQASTFAGLDKPDLVKMVAARDVQISALKQQLAWFKRQVFGAKSERFAAQPDPLQMHLGELGALPQAQVPVPGKISVPGHTRTRRASDCADDGLGAGFFDERQVAVQVIQVPNADLQGLSREDYEVVSEKYTHRLAQRPGSCVVLKYVRQVVKLKASQTLSCPAAPAGVLEGSRADVSFLAGVMMDKFAWHLPLYRQHQRLQAQGFKLSRQWLTQLVQDGAALLAPIYEAQLASIRASRVKAMDETPIKVGQAAPGKMGSGYFWPVLGEQDEICFTFFDSRKKACVEQALGLGTIPDAVLISDGYAAYARYAEKTGITHAQCWAHTRRHFFEAKDIEPEAAAQALQHIAALYDIEAQIRERKLKGEAKKLHRLLYSKPRVEQFFAWLDAQLDSQGFLPSNPMTKALVYARERRSGLQVYLSDPDVPIDTNHLERALRVIPMGKKNWMFCWTELGAQHTGILQSLIVTCRMHDIDPYTYLVDVLQRVATHPNARVAELTPRLWKQHFADQPMRSDLHGLG